MGYEVVNYTASEVFTSYFLIFSASILISPIFDFLMSIIIKGRDRS